MSKRAVVQSKTRSGLSSKSDPSSALKKQSKEKTGNSKSDKKPSTKLQTLSKTSAKEETDSRKLSRQSKTIQKEINGFQRKEIVKKSPEKKAESISPRHDAVLEASNDKLQVASSDKSEDEYSDDFENYESDFEEEMEEEERKNEEIDEQIQQEDSATDQVLLTSTKNNVEETSRNREITVIPKKPIEKTQIPQLTIPRSTQMAKVEKSPVVNNNYHLNFNTAKQQLTQNKTSSNLRKRWSYLKAVIQLDSVSTNHYSQTPLPYEVFMTIYGVGHSAQACVQTGDDNVSDDCQTDAVETIEQWTQFPPHINCDTSRKQPEKLPFEIGLKVKDWKHLVQFVRKSSKVMCGLLEEEYLANVNINNPGNMFAGSKSILFQPPKLMQNHSVVYVTYAMHQPYKILVIYSTNQNNSNSSRNILLHWDARWPSKPQRLLSCYSQPTCCCLDGHSKVAVAGMFDGSLAVWDLEEADNVHNRVVLNKEEWTFRIPSYSTAVVLKENGHQSPVKAVKCFEEQSGVIQVTSLEESAIFHVWTVMELNSSREDDLGMSPHSHIYLIKTFTVDLQLDQGISSGGLRVTTYAIQPHNPSLVLVATDAGFAFSSSLILNKRQRIFRHELGLPVEVVSLSFLTDGQCFLAAFKDSTVQLFTMRKEKPIKVWHFDEEIMSVCCSQTTIFALNIEGNIQLWKLSDEDEKTTNKRKSKQKAKFIDVTGERRSQLVIGYETGAVELNILLKNI